MNFEQFSHGSSVLHRTDPRIKIITALFLCAIVAITHNLHTAGAGLILAFLFILSTGISITILAKRLAVINSVNFALWVLLPLTYGKLPYIDILGLHISLSGFSLAALITLKANAILLFLISLIATSSVAAIGHGLQELRLSKQLCMLLLFSYRYIFVIHQEYNRLYRAAQLRCFVPVTNIHTYKTMSYLLGMLLVKSWNRATRVQQAMELRGFSGRFYPLHDLQLKISDIVVLAILGSAGSGLLWIEFTTFQ